MIWHTIRIGFGLGLVGLLVMAVEVQALACGDTISRNTTLRRNLLNCPGDGLIIGASGINLNVNGKRITGTGSGSAVGVAIENVTNVTIRNGTVRNFSTQIFIRESNGTRVRNMVLNGPENIGIQVQSSNHVDVRQTRIRNLRSLGLLVISSDGFELRNSRISNVGTGSQTSGGLTCGGGNGISSFLSSGVRIMNNLFTRISRSGILHVASPDGNISGNTISNTSSRPCNDDFGAITITAGSGRTVVASNRILDNDDFGIGLRQNVEDIKIRNNKLQENTGGIFLSRGAAGTQLRRNCISQSVTGIGLLVDPTDSSSTTYAVDALRNYWGARNGPSGDGPLGIVLSGDGEEIVQKLTDEVAVVPFMNACR